MTEWAKFVSGVMFLDFFGPRSAVPFFAPVRRQRGAGPRDAPQVPRAALQVPRPPNPRDASHIGRWLQRTTRSWARSRRQSGS